MSLGSLNILWTRHVRTHLRLCKILGTFVSEQRSIKIFAVLNPDHTAPLSKYFTPRIAINIKAPVFRLELSEFGAFISLAELGIVQLEGSQIVGFLNSQLHCTTLRVVNRQDAIKQKARSMSGLFGFIGSLHALRRAQGRSIGGQQNCLLS